MPLSRPEVSIPKKKGIEPSGDLLDRNGDRMLLLVFDNLGSGSAKINLITLESKLYLV